VLATFLNRTLSLPGHNVVTLLVGEFSRTIPKSDHEPGGTATVIGKYVTRRPKRSTAEASGKGRWCSCFQCRVFRFCSPRPASSAGRESPGPQGPLTASDSLFGHRRSEGVASSAHFPNKAGEEYCSDYHET